MPTRQSLARRRSAHRGELGAVYEHAPSFKGLSITAVDVISTYNPLTVATAGMAATVAMVKSTSVQKALAAGDKITQTFDGSGSIDSSDFRVMGGVAVPKNIPASNFAKAFQRQLNRVGYALSMGKVGEDGKIGPASLAILRKIQAAKPWNALQGASAVMGDPSSPLYIAADADVIGDQLRDLADRLKAPTAVTAPASVPTIVTASGSTVIVPPPGSTGSPLDAFSGMSGGQKLMFAGIIGGIGFVAYRKLRNKRGRGFRVRRRRN